LNNSSALANCSLAKGISEGGNP